MKRCLGMLAIVMGVTASAGDALVDGFRNPPDPAKPWVFWFWINGNISREGITADLEAMKQVGIGGALWMEVSGMAWAPDGKVKAHTPAWHDCMQWAVKECDRLGLELDLTLDFGYGSGGPHISPTNSMQRLCWSETEIEGGRPVDLALPKPEVDRRNVAAAWLRPGAAIDPRVRETIETVDSYRDVAVLAIPAPASPKARVHRIPELNLKDGTHWGLPKGAKSPELPDDGVTPVDRVVDLTGRMGPDGRLTWDAPPGKWLVMRCGHASNYKMTRPCPQAAVGLECDRLSKSGIDAHYGAFLKPIFDGAGEAAGRALTHVHIDSWEAGGQNWTAAFPAEFRARRGYDLRPWMPVLAGRVVGSAELSDRFLWDMRATVSEMIRDNYAGRLRELAQRHRMKLSIEAYGHLCIDNLAYAGVCDFPISEFWARGTNTFPDLLAGRGGYAPSTKAMASAAHTYGRPVIGAEAWTSDRGWRDHPYLMKAMGDEMYCRGLNRVIFHLSAHQAYDGMIPGLTHRKWGEHIQRHNTWWGYSRPWMDYLARCQHMLQQGEFVADVVYWVGEGAPLNVDQMKLDLPAGYDFDFCSSENVLRMGVKDGRIFLPSGANYRYLLLPDTDRMTLPLARKVQGLVTAGARVIGGPRPAGTPGLTGFPGSDAELESIATALWGKGLVTTGATPAEVFARDNLPPDFEGGGLRHIHRRVGDTDLYFIANGEPARVEVVCTFRVAGKRPELWQPETGRTMPVAAFEEAGGATRIPLALEPAGSVFVVFRPGSAPERLVSVKRNGRELLSFDKPAAKSAATEATNTFTMVAWARPSADTSLPREATVGTVARLPRNDAVYPPPGHEVWGATQAGAGVAVGRNGVCVHEHGAAYFSTSLAHAAMLTNWVHVAVVYRDATPALYLDGRMVRTGLKSPRAVHPGVGISHQREVAPFGGELAGVQAFDHALAESEIVALAAARPAGDAEGTAPALDLMSRRILKSGEYELKTADGGMRRLSVALPPPLEVAGPWQVGFDPKWGGPAGPVAFERLEDWSKRAEEGIRYYSGTATYRKVFDLPAEIGSRKSEVGGGHPSAADLRPLTSDLRDSIFLDLGSVEVMARVRVNGKDCGIAWKPPYRVDISAAVREGANDLEIDVVNLWINRMIGDEQLPLDGNWKDFETLLEWPEWFIKGTPRTSGRFTFSSCRHYTKDTSLVPSGLLGPVTLLHAAEAPR